MDNWKIIGLVLGGCIVLVVLAAFGLSRVSGGSTTETKADQNVLVDGARWISGSNDAKVTVVEFSDMQCPACKAAQPFAEEIKKTEGVRFVLRHFPLLQLHQNAWMGARAAEAARMMGKGDEYVSSLFARQNEWSSLGNPEEKFILYAKDLGLAEDEFGKLLRIQQRCRRRSIARRRRARRGSTTL